jgi:hypothetical protein
MNGVSGKFFWWFATIIIISKRATAHHSICVIVVIVVRFLTIPTTTIRTLYGWRINRITYWPTRNESCDRLLRCLLHPIEVGIDIPWEGKHIVDSHSTILSLATDDSVFFHRSMSGKDLAGLFHSFNIYLFQQMFQMRLSLSLSPPSHCS